MTSNQEDGASRRRPFRRRRLLAIGLGVAGTALTGFATLDRVQGSKRDELLRRLASTTGADMSSLPSARKRFLAMVNCPGKRIYVAGHGSDTNPGTRAAPLRQINAAVGLAEAGDLILVDSGHYGYTEISNFHGSADGWLGIMTVNDSAKAIVTVPPPTDNFCNVIASSYVGIYGLEVVGDQRNSNTNGSGISVYGGSHHIALWRNHVHDFPGGGINCFDANGSHDMIDIRYNKIHGTSRYSPSNTSGISIHASQDLTRGEHFADGYGYRISHNYIYDALCEVPFTPGGHDYVTDGNGISLDLIASTHGYRKPILVSHNIITGCGARGVHAFNTVNVDVSRNTVAGNMRTESPAITGGAAIDGTVDETVRCVANVICPTHTPNTTDDISTYEGNVILGGSQRVPAGNHDLRDLGLNYFAETLSAESLITGTELDAFKARVR